ncbi:DUF5677 domain-containing protein [Streptomyces sp. NPDC127077]|uniref:DUF5677 domain-containing protein n=1 Tax=Streptomyces sp. NPDC127077 TaxID=3347131 RepID=UPI00364EE113
MTFAYRADERTAKRVRAILPKLIAGANEAITVQSLASGEVSSSVFAVLAGWWRFTNRTAEALLALYDSGFTVEASPLMRNLVNHAYAVNWLADNGEDGYRALIDESYESRRKLRDNLQALKWQLPENVDIGEAPDFGFTSEEEKKRHRRLCGELSNFENMVKAYGSPMMYPVYRNLSSFSHTTDLTAAAFVSIDDEDQVTIYENGRHDRLADFCWMPVPLLQAASVMSPLLKGNPMKRQISEACRDLGLPDDLVAKRV